MAGIYLRYTINWAIWTIRWTLNAAMQQYHAVRSPVCWLTNVQAETIRSSSEAIIVKWGLVICSIFRIIRLALGKRFCIVVLFFFTHGYTIRISSSSWSRKKKGRRKSIITGFILLSSWGLSPSENKSCPSALFCPPQSGGRS